MSWAPVIHLYAGPTLWDAVLPADIVLHPPAMAGDLLAQRHGPPCTLLLVDGLFEQRRSPWHKEILLLLSLGFRVIGAASMGALRAAELDRAGMLGVGAIYRAFRGERLFGDDEVALLHAPAELRFRPLTTALVDVRGVLVDAVKTRSVSAVAARTMLAEARAVPFRERGDDCLEDLAVRHDLPRGCFDPSRPGLKARDALAAIALAQRFRHVPAVAAPPPPRTVYLATLLRASEL